MSERRLGILVVDDNEDFLDVVSSIFEPFGWRIRTAISGRVALEALETDSFDAVITDLNMPVMTGFELIRALRRDARFTALPIIVLTGYYSTECVDRLNALGVQAIMAKPIDVESLRQQIMACVPT